MTKTEQELLFKLLIELFLESPQRIDKNQQEKIEENHAKVSTTAPRTRVSQSHRTEHKADPEN